MKITEVTEDDLANIIKTSDKKLLIEVYATWCEPCTLMRPVLDAVATETTDCDFCAVDTDAAPAFSDHYGIEVVPTFLIFSKGVLLNRLTGPKTKSALLSALSRVV